MTHAILRRFSCHLLSMPRLQCLHHFPIERSQTSQRSQYLQETASISCSQFASMCLTWKVKLQWTRSSFLPCLSAWLAPSVSLCQLPVPAASDICIHLFDFVCICVSPLWSAQGSIMSNYVPLPPKNSLYARRKQTEPRDDMKWQAGKWKKRTSNTDVSCTYISGF